MGARLLPIAFDFFAAAFVAGARNSTPFLNWL
jgi:hypothetical protein